jgi:hydrogenase maturation protease
VQQPSGADLSAAHAASENPSFGGSFSAGSVTITVLLTEPLDLLEVWEGTDLAVVVDAIRSGAPAGTVTLSWLDAQGSAPIRVARADRASTHGLGVADVYTLACELGSAPRRVAIVGIEGGDFSNGEGLSAPVEQAVSRAAGLVVELASGGRDDFRTCALPV